MISYLLKVKKNEGIYKIKTRVLLQYTGKK